MMKPRMLVLGGCGFIGRNLVEHLVTQDLVSGVRVVDKVPTQTAWLNDRHKAVFEDPRVQLKSANLINPDACRAAFNHDDGEKFDFVVNCACETRPGQTDPIYQEGILKLSLNCAREAALVGVKRYVELSSGAMGSSKQVAHKESDKKEPWTNVARWKSKAEDALQEIPGLNYTILRPAIVYGSGDRNGMMPLLMMGAIYKHLGETMKLLWSPELRMNTVHVKDVCNAIWHVLQHPATVNEIYNVVDDGNSTQSVICELVADIFQIDHGYWGATISSFAKTDLTSVVEEVNEKHLSPWAAMCKTDAVTNTPLSPFIDVETLSKNHMHLDGAKLLQTGFHYSVPRITASGLKAILQEYVDMNLFPGSYVS